MAEVVLYVYDMTKSGDGHDVRNFSVVQMNKLFKDAVNFGGIFHTAVQIYGNDEWTYGYRNKGTGVFSCPAGKNPSYTLREKLVMGRTECSPSKVNKMLKELSDSWPGDQYNIVSKNSNNFSNELLERLGVPKLPGWVNRFTNIADTAKGVTGTLLKAKDEALKRVFNPLSAFGSSSKKNSAPRAVKDTPIEFNINVFNIFAENFKVSAPDINNDDHDQHHFMIQQKPVIIHAIEEPPALDNKTDDEPIVDLVDEDDDEDDEPVAVKHKDEKPVAIPA